MTKRRTFSKAIEDLENSAGDIGSDVRDRLEDELEKLKPHIDEIKGKLNDGYYETKDRVEKEIEKNPWAAMGIVAVIFFIIGYLLSGRRRD